MGVGGHLVSKVVVCIENNPGHLRVIVFIPDPTFKRALA